jgi:hypothetical protein
MCLLFGFIFHMWANMWPLSFWAWLTSHNMIFYCIHLLLHQHSTTAWVRPRPTVSTGPKCALSSHLRGKWPCTLKNCQTSVHLPSPLWVSLIRVSSHLPSVSVTALSGSPSYVFLFLPKCLWASLTWYFYLLFSVWFRRPLHLCAVCSLLFPGSLWMLPFCGPQCLGFYHFFLVSLWFSLSLVWIPCADNKVWHTGRAQQMFVEWVSEWPFAVFLTVSPSPCFGCLTSCYL